MNDLSAWLPRELIEWIQTQIASGRYFDEGDYLRDIIRRDRAQVKEAERLRAAISEKLASSAIKVEPG